MSANRDSLVRAMERAADLASAERRIPLEGDLLILAEFVRADDPSGTWSPVLCTRAHSHLAEQAWDIVRSLLEVNPYPEDMEVVDVKHTRYYHATILDDLWLIVVTRGQGTKRKVHSQELEFLY